MVEKKLPLAARIIFYFLGLLILTLGASLILKCQLGAGAWDALAAAQSRLSGLKVGYWIWINGIILLFVNAWLLKARPQYSAIITFVLIGTLVNWWMYDILYAVTPTTNVGQWAFLIGGILILSLGVSFYLQVNLPSNPIDMLMVAIHQRFGLSLGMSKMIGEIMAFIVAFILAGPIGIGTVVVTICIGPIVQYLFPFTKRVMLRFSK
ncbi:MAG: YitT family protein [Bacillaceae bacterium]